MKNEMQWRKPSGSHKMTRPVDLSGFVAAFGRTFFAVKQLASVKFRPAFKIVPRCLLWLVIGSFLTFVFRGACDSLSGGGTSGTGGGCPGCGGGGGGGTPCPPDYQLLTYEVGTGASIGCQTTVTTSYKYSTCQKIAVYNFYINNGSGCVPSYVNAITNELTDQCCAPGGGGGITITPSGTNYWGHIQVYLTNISVSTFTVMSPTNIDHFAVYDLSTGNAVFASGTLSGSTPTLTISNSLFAAGGNYAVTSCTSNNFIQGSACFKAGTGAISPLFQFEGWQNVSTNLPGATIAAVVDSDQVETLGQYADGTVTVGSGTVSSSVVYQGLTNTTLGGATLEVSGSSLYVTNLSSSGQDGVSIALPANMAGLDVQIQPLDTDNSLPIGAYIQEQLIGTGDGVTNGLLGTVTATKMGTTNYSITADFSPIGDSGFTYEGYLNGGLAVSGTGTNADPVGRTFVPTTYGTAGGLPYVDWPSGGGTQFGFGAYVDTVALFPHHLDNTVTAFKIVTSGISGFTILSESQGFAIQRMTNTLPVGYSLIANQLDHGSNTADILFPNADGARDGDTLEKYNCSGYTVYYFDSASPTGFAASKGGSPVAAPTLNPGEGAFYNNTHALNSVVFAGTPHVPVLPAALPCGFGQPTLLSRQTNDIGTYQNITGYAPQAGARVETWNGSGFTVSSYNSATGTWGGGTPSLAVGQSALFTVPSGSQPITNIVSLVYQGVTNTSIGSATISVSGNSLYVTNLGSSGQDGLTISFPSNFVGMTLGWQPLVAGDSMPVGGYITEQAIGTLNGVANSVLGTVTMTKTSTTNFSFAADFSPLGVSSNTVLAYRQGQLVGQGTAPNGTVIANETAPSSGGSSGGSGGGDFWISPCTSGIISPNYGKPCWTDFLMSVPMDELPCGIAGMTGTVTVDDLEFGDATQSTMQFTISALKITASQVPYFVITNENETLAYQGLANTSVGNATLAVSGNSLYITNLSSSGQDGVSITAPAGLAGFDVQVQDLDPSNSLPIGAFVKQTLIGTYNGTPNSILGILTSTKTGPTNVSVTADFSAIGASTYSVQTSYQGVMTAQASHQTGGNAIQIAPWPCTNCPPQPPLGTTYLYSTNTGNYIGEDWGYAVAVLSSAIPNAIADHLYFNPDGLTSVVTVTAMQLTASQIPNLTITAENASLAYQGLANTSLGNAAISATGNSLYITNLGSSGQDGVSIALPANQTGLDVVWQALDASDTLPVGAYIRSQAIGTANGIANGVLGTLTDTKLGTTNYQIAVDFSALGATTYNAYAYYRGALVGQATNQPMIIAMRHNQFSGSADTAYTGGPSHIGIEYISLDWNATGTYFAFSGGPSLLIDQLEVTPGDVTWTNVPTALQVVGSQISALTITGENQPLVYQGLINTAIGSATISVSGSSLYVTNLGSSGQDGVTISVPSNLLGLNVAWQPLNAGGSMPIGAYVTEQEIGTLNGIPNSVLGTVTMTKTGSTSFSFTADFSPLGVASNTVLAYQNREIVAQGSGSNGSEIVSEIDPAGGGSGGGDIELSPCVTGYYSPQIIPCPYKGMISYSMSNLPCLLAGQTTYVTADNLEFAAATLPAVQFTVSSLKITASQVSGLTITSENASYAYGGMASAEIGNATATVSGGQLYITNLSSSGQDGVAISIPDNQSILDVQLQPVDPSNTLPIGAYLQSQVIGTFNGITNGVLGTVTATKTGTNNISVSADFSPSGASTYSIQAYYQGTLVGQATNQTASASMEMVPAPNYGCQYCPPWPHSWGWGYWGCWGDWGYWGCWTYPYFPRLNRFPIDLFWNWYEYPVYLSINGSANILVDHLYLSADNVQLPVPASAVQLTASQIPAFSLSGASVTPLVLTASQTSNNLTLRWIGTGILQSTSDLRSTNWSTVSGATSPYTVPSSNGTSQFYRVNQVSP